MTEQHQMAMQVSIHAYMKDYWQLTITRVRVQRCVRERERRAVNTCKYCGRSMENYYNYVTRNCDFTCQAHCWHPRQHAVAQSKQHKVTWSKAWRQRRRQQSSFSFLAAYFRFWMIFAKRLNAGGVSFILRVKARLHFRDEQHLTATKASSITGNTIFAAQVHSGLTAPWFNSGHP